MTYATRHRWSDEEIDVVRREYQGTHASRDALADKLGVSPNAVARIVSQNGLAKNTDRRRWTLDEVERLRELTEQHSINKVAKLMGRSLNSVTVKANKLHISRRDRSGWFTKKEVCEILGKDPRWVQRRIDDGTLPAFWHHGRQPQQKGASAWHIKQADLKGFLRRYPDELNGRNVDLVSVVAILAGIIYEVH